MSERVKPRGNPLPEWIADTVSISPEEIVAAILQWDEDVPDAAGLLMAIPEDKGNASTR